MRIKITCDIGEGIHLPINYNYFLTGIIYQFLKNPTPNTHISSTKTVTNWRIDGSNCSPSPN